MISPTTIQIKITYQCPAGIYTVDETFAGETDEVKEKVEDYLEAMCNTINDEQSKDY